MTTDGRINPETLSAFLEGLPDLLESLRAQGYGLGTRQHVAAHELVGSLFAHGGLPPTLLELDEWLAPLICFTPVQQEDFRERYLQWLIEKRLVDEEDLPADPPPVKVPTPPPTLPRPSVGERIVRRVSSNRLSLIVAGALLVVAAALFIAYQLGTAYLKDEDLTQVVVLNPPVPQPTPVPTPLVDDDVVVVVTPPSTEPVEGLAWDVDKKTVEATPSPTPTPTPPPPPGFWVRNFQYVVALTLVTPFAGLGLWHFLRRRRRRRDAERWRDDRPRYDKIKVRGARERVFQSAALRPIARGLRHYLSVESRQLDARSTVRASVGRGGLFTPVYGTRRTLPEYLVLIDRVGFGDQLAQFNSDIVARLGEHDVYLDTYYFHSDPRRCREGGADSPQLSLSDLAARHPDHFLIIFSDGTGLMSTTTGRPEPFVEQLLHWRGRALLTPIPKLEWEYREWALEREGLKVLPASIDGLRLLVEAVNTGARSVRAPDFDETPPYPDILREQPTLWKERDEPPPNQTRRLVTHLRRYLGPEGFELLCACAVYPVMQWGVTLFLAYELLGRSKVDGVLPRLLRLPWFRNGTMPQWLRRILIRELPRARRRLVRERLEHLLLAFLEDPERGLRPRFAEEQTAIRTSLLTSISERLAAWRRSRLLRRRLQHAPARSPLAEPVFLNYITNNQRAEALPEPVRDKLFPRGVAAFGLRLAPAAALVLVAVLTGLLLLLLERPTDNIYTPGAPENLCALLCPRQSANTTDPDFTYTPTTAKQGQTVNVTVKAITKGAYDLSSMWLAPAGADNKTMLNHFDAGGKFFSFTSTGKSTDTLSAAITVAPDAPLGQTELLLYDGDKLRARLPFNVTASNQVTSPQQQCPNIQLRAVNVSVDADRTNFKATVILVSPPAASFLTYSWSGREGVEILGGQGTRSLAVRGVAQGRPYVNVRVGGLPPGCPNAMTLLFSNNSVSSSTPASTLNVTVEPQSITVCPSNPKLNEPPDSVVKVVVSLNPVDLRASLDATVTGGKLIERGVTRANAPMYDWNLSGMSPGTYTVTGWGSPASDQSQEPKYTQTQMVTVKGCPDTSPGIPPGVLSNAAQATNDLRTQVVDMTRLAKDLAGKGMLTSNEYNGVTYQLARMEGGLSSLDNNLKTLTANPADRRSSSYLAGQVALIYSALKDLESQLPYVKDSVARSQLTDRFYAMQKLFSQLDQLRQPLATSPGDE